MTDNPKSVGAEAVAGEIVGSNQAVPLPPLRVAINSAAIVKSGSSAVESLSALRNYLVAQHINFGRRALAVCAPHTDAGCTYVASNLALSCAQAGINTLLIDGNMRDPQIDQIFTPDRPVAGLCEFLKSEEDEPPFLAANIRPGLSVIYANSAGEAASDLLAGQRLKTLINESVRSFDLTIIDCPPSAHYGDARRIASLLRYAVVVARRDHSFAAHVKTLVNELKSDGVSVVGTFLNIID